MTHLVIYFSLIAFAIFTQASNQKADNKLIYKDGFIILDRECKCSYLDTIPNRTMASIPTLLIVSKARIIGIDGCGQLYMSANLKAPIVEPVFKSKSCMGLKEPKKNFIITPAGIAYFISIDDGYFKKRSFKLIEFNLINHQSKVVDSGDSLDNLAYTSDYNQLLYSKDGINKFYNYPK